MKAKVLHIWNTAGIGGLLCRYMDRQQDYESKCLHRIGFDRYNLANEKVEFVQGGAAIFVARASLESRKYDIIHIHDSINIFRVLRRLYPKKKIALHFHGSAIRSKWEKQKNTIDKADYLFISTPDLFSNESPQHTVWVPNVVNEGMIEEVLELMKNRKTRGADKAFHVSHNADDIAKKFAKMFDMKLDIRNRIENPREHREFLIELKTYDFYIDVKRDFEPYSRWEFVDGRKEFEEAGVLEYYSLTGLEALRLGLSVIRWDGQLIEEFPDVHRSEIVTKWLDSFYRWGKEK